jgi:hypothetical protein
VLTREAEQRLMPSGLPDGPALPDMSGGVDLSDPPPASAGAGAGAVAQPPPSLQKPVNLTKSHADPGG